MVWSDATLWWIGAGCLVAIEMATGTFYLLMLALGCAAAALAAHAGLSQSGQLVSGALVGGGAVLGWHFARGRRPPSDPQSSRDVNIDVGERVEVTAWQPDGTARVRYRGADWNARFDGTGAPAPGPHVIRAIDGSRLLLERAPL